MALSFVREPLQAAYTNEWNVGFQEKRDTPFLFLRLFACLAGAPSGRVSSARKRIARETRQRRETAGPIDHARTVREILLFSEGQGAGFVGNAQSAKRRGLQTRVERLVGYALIPRKSYYPP